MNTNRIRSKWAAVGAAVAVSLGAGGIGISHATTATGEKPIYLPIEPCRLVDTRPAFQVGPRSAPLGPNETYDLSGWGAVGGCTLPANTAGLALNVTAVDPTAATFLTLFPAGVPLPLASNLNPTPGAPPTPNAVNVDLNAAGLFSIYNLAGNVHVIIDVLGIYDDHIHDDRYYTEAEIDTAFGDAVISDDGKSAYAYSCSSSQPIGAAYNVTSNCAYSYNPSGSPVTVTRTAVGRYSVAFPGLLMSQGHVQVTAYGGTNSQCKVAGWSNSSVSVRCYNPAGALTNAPFTVLALD